MRVEKGVTSSRPFFRLSPARRVTPATPASFDAPCSWIAIGFLALAMILGGGGSPNPATELLLELACVLAVAAWLWLPTRQGIVATPAGNVPWIVAALVVILPLVQLVPLPPQIWQSLPGQADRAAALALIGSDNGWHPLSTSPPRTLASLLALLPPLCVMLATASLSSRSRRGMLAAAAAVALASAVLGGMQVSLGPSAPRLYALSNDTLTGFQANKNAAADVLLIGMIAAAAALAPSLSATRDRAAMALLPSRRAGWMAFGAAMLVLVLAVLLTNSRAGIALVPVALAGVWATFGSKDRRKWRVAAMIALIAVVVIGLLAVTSSNVLTRVAARFAATDDFRRELWRDAWFAISHSWPAGIGMGGAAPALIAAERLEVVDSSAPNRVHNDYLELLLEGGALAVVLLAAVILALAVTARRTWRTQPDARGHVLAGGAILAIIGLHSLVDYPLRSMALACLAGMGAGLLMKPAKMDAQSAGAADGIRRSRLEA